MDSLTTNLRFSAGGPHEFVRPSLFCITASILCPLIVPEKCVEPWFWVIPSKNHSFEERISHEEPDGHHQ